jgi:hypothetical protein
MNILALFFDIDEFCKLFEPAWRHHLLAGTCRKRNRKRRLSLSEVMTILVLLLVCFRTRRAAQLVCDAGKCG